MALYDLRFKYKNCTFNNISSINNGGIIYSSSDDSINGNTINIIDTICELILILILILVIVNVQGMMAIVIVFIQMEVIYILVWYL